MHSLNILRALYRESRLGDDVVSYVADGLKAAILGFRSEQWAVSSFLSSFFFVFLFCLYRILLVSFS